MRKNHAYIYDALVFVRTRHQIHIGLCYTAAAIPKQNRMPTQTQQTQFPSIYLFFALAKLQ